MEQATRVAFSQLVGTRCRTDSDVIAVLQQTYDILECSIADFLEQFKNKNQVCQTSPAQLVKAYDFVCPGCEQDSMFIQQMETFISLVDERQAQIFPYKDATLLQKLQVLELYNYETIVDEELLNLSFAMFGIHCASICEFAQHFADFSEFVSRVCPEQLPGSFVSKIIGHSISFGSNFQSSAEPQALQRIIETLHEYYLPGEYMATRFVAYLLQLGEEARLHCALLKVNCLAEAILLSASRLTPDIDVSAWIRGLLSYVVFGIVGQRVDQQCVAAFFVQIEAERPCVSLQGISEYGICNDKLASWLWRLFCEKHQLENQWSAASSEHLQNPENQQACATEERTAEMEAFDKRPDVSPISQHEPNGTGEDLAPEENARAKEDGAPVSAPRYVVRGHVVVQ